MKEQIILFFTAGIGTLGFAFYFHIKARNIGMAIVGALISFIAYVIVMKQTNHNFLASMIASMIVAAWSEILARVMKAPTNIFLITGIIPLLPGGALYYTMNALIEENRGDFVRNGMITITSTLGIATGIVIASVFVVYFINRTKEWKNRNVL